MPAPSRLVLFVEGPGDRDALPLLVKQLLTEMDAWANVFLDDRPFMVGNVAELTKGDGKDWIGYLNAARKRSRLGAVLLVQDGDLASIRKEEFCAARFAGRLCGWAKTAGAGKLFSVATVFACQEYESWVLACADCLAGQRLPDDRPGIREGSIPPEGDLDKHPRNAKKWLDQHIDAGYKETRDQALITQLMVNHLDAIRERGLRSFRRLESALRQLVDAVGNNSPIVSPDDP